MENKKRDTKFFIVSLAMIICYIAVYFMVVDHGGLLPRNFNIIQDISQDISEYYAILQVFHPIAILLFTMMTYLYGLLARSVCKIKGYRNLLAKFFAFVTILFLINILFGIISFQYGTAIGTSRTAVILQVHFLSIIFFRKGVVSILFFIIAFYPICALILNNRVKNETN